MPFDSKSGENGADDIRASGRDGERCPLNGSWVWCSEKDMTHKDE